MKGIIRPKLGEKLRQEADGWMERPGAKTVCQMFAALAVGFFLSGFSLAGTHMPLSVALAAALGLGLSSFGAYLGGCLGYAAFWGLGTAMEPMAAGLLVEACACIWGDQLSEKNRWFGPVCAAVFTALVGVLFLLENFSSENLWRYSLRIAVAGGSALCFQTAIEPQNRICKQILLACLCGGLCALKPAGFPLGLIAACALAANALSAPEPLTAAAMYGLALDLSWGGGCVTAALLLGALGCREQSRFWPRLGLWLGCCGLGGILTGTQPVFLAAAVMGAGLSLLLPKPKALPSNLQEKPEVREAENLASGLLEQISRCLTRTRPDKPDPETAAVFDQAAERVCRMCSLWDDCWGENIQETCGALNQAAPAMMTRGKALREDLPAVFTGRCRHMEGFLNAVNRELDDLSCRRQYRSRLKESRVVMASQYHALSLALGKKEPEQREPLCYRPELGAQSRSRRGDSLSGDQGHSFQQGRWFYVLLCDGMGTGQGAAAEAGAAIAILRTLLLSGVNPPEALETLNGVYILRDDGCFATVDLLQTDLVTGEAQLYKWGGAPSYIKRGNAVERIGTVSPPPGIGVGEAHRPEGARLSLSNGEMIVLVSDGVGGEAAESLIRQYGGLSPKELASDIVGCNQSQGEDDRTAVVLALRSSISR